jgi:hypothetical protein
MYKSGLILGALALFVAAGATIISPVCVPCLVVFLGLGAGYLAGVFDKPNTSDGAAKAGAIGGALGGLGAIIGQAAGAAINSVMIGPQRAQQLYQVFGIPSSGPGFTQSYWLGVVGSTVCISLIDVLVMAAFGTLGAYIWWQSAGKNINPPDSTVAS